MLYNINNKVIVSSIQKCYHILWLSLAYLSGKLKQYFDYLKGNYLFIVTINQIKNTNTS